MEERLGVGTRVLILAGYEAGGAGRIENVDSSKIPYDIRLEAPGANMSSSCWKHHDRVVQIEEDL